MQNPSSKAKTRSQRPRKASLICAISKNHDDFLVIGNKLVFHPFATLRPSRMTEAEQPLSRTIEKPVAMAVVW